VETTISLVLGVIFYAHQSEKEDDIAEVPVLEELESFSNALSLNWQDISGAYDCSSFLGYTVRAGLQHYASKKMQILSSEDPSLASEILRHALRARFIIEQDLDFKSRMEAEADLAMLRFLLDIGADPNAELPRSDRSVWYDFLLTLKQDFREKGLPGDPAWDMSTYLDPSRLPLRCQGDENNENEEAQKDSNKPKAVWLPNWYEACEILISRGARDRMHKIVLSQSFKPFTRTQYSYILASDSIPKIFTPEQTRALWQRYKSMEPPIPSSIWSRIFPFYQR
jgi:hypothetical protein